MLLKYLKAMEHKNPSLDEINKRIIYCDLCPRLANYIDERIIKQPGSKLIDIDGEQMEG